MSNEHFVLMSGNEAPLGAFVRDGGCNFSVWAPEATKVTLILYTDNEQEIVRYELPEKHDGLWFGFVKNVRPGQLYAYSVDGVNDPKNGLSFDASKVLIDPYAKKLNRPVDWNYDLYLNDSGRFISKSVVVDDNAFDWQGVKKPGLTKDRTILYETHVKGFTKLRDDIPEEYRGTYLGLSHPNVIKYLKDLGITAVQATEFGEMPVNFKAETNGTYTMSFNSNNVEFSYLHLIDNLTGNDVDLVENPSYTFDANTSDYSSRFKLVFATGDANNNSEFAFVSNGSIIVNGEGTLQVIDMTGRIVSSEQVNGVSSIKLNAAAGVYVLQLNDKTQKIVVK